MSYEYISTRDSTVVAFSKKRLLRNRRSLLQIKTLTFVLIFCALLFVGLYKQTQSLSNKRPHTSPSSAILDENQQTALNTPENPKLSGFFKLQIDVDSPFIEVDLSKQVEFRTSQLVMSEGKLYPSRKVFYSSTSEVKGVVVLPIDPYARHDVLQRVVEERKRFCEIHNYGLFARYIQDFAAEGQSAKVSLGLAKSRMLRQAMQAFPDSEWFWLYSSSGHIQHEDEPMLPYREDSTSAMAMDPIAQVGSVSITNFAMDRDKTEFMVSTNDTSGFLSSESIFARNSLTGRTTLEFMLDPIFQNSEKFTTSNDHSGSVLTHVARWHKLLVNHIALVSPHFAGTAVCSDITEDYQSCMRSAAD